MYRLLLLVPFFLLFTACSQQTRELSLEQHSNTKAVAYSLEALDARYQRGY